MDALLQRLGKSPDKLESIVTAGDYELYIYRENIQNCILGKDYSNFYNIFNDENKLNKALKFAADRKGGYPFLTGCGGNNVFAPLPAFE